MIRRRKAEPEQGCGANSDPDTVESPATEPPATELPWQTVDDPAEPDDRPDDLDAVQLDDRPDDAVITDSDARNDDLTLLEPAPEPSSEDLAGQHRVRAQEAGDRCQGVLEHAQLQIARLRGAIQAIEAETEQHVRELEASSRQNERAEVCWSEVARVEPQLAFLDSQCASAQADVATAESAVDAALARESGLIRACAEAQAAETTAGSVDDEVQARLTGMTASVLLSEATKSTTASRQELQVAQSHLDALLADREQLAAQLERLTDRARLASSGQLDAVEQAEREQAELVRQEQERAAAEFRSRQIAQTMGGPAVILGKPDSSGWVGLDTFVGRGGKS